LTKRAENCNAIEATGRMEARQKKQADKTDMGDQTDRDRDRIDR
jgi:hypothetical protein